MNSSNFEDYLKSLNVEITYELNNEEKIPRISELSRKTNQFIFNYKRYSEAELEKIIKDKDYAVVSTVLKDKLSDSGIICVCTGKNTKNGVELEECFVSCRALGRGLDEIIVLGSIQFLLNHFNSKKLKIFFTKGERNLPAENFINKHLTQNLTDYANFKYENNYEFIKILYKEKV